MRQTVYVLVTIVTLSFCYMMQNQAERNFNLNNQYKSSKENVILCGLAFDNKDEHKRITTGENFYIVGGSQETHENLVEKVMEFNETVKKYGKKLDGLSETEYYDIVKTVCSNKEKMYWFYNA